MLILINLEFKSVETLVERLNIIWILSSKGWDKQKKIKQWRKQGQSNWNKVKPCHIDVQKFFGFQRHCVHNKLAGVHL